MRKCEAFPLNPGTRWKYPHSLLMFYIVIEVLAKAIRQNNEMKRLLIGKEVVKISLFVNDMILCIRDPKVCSKEFLVVLNTFSKMARYKINIEKSVAFLHTNNMHNVEESNNKNPIYSSY